ncbi:MAG: permease-like cell division protein FtsX [Actinomycetota bacterium]|nr:permease-like cell division protein FtsX [Actinomycetota bacterium]
MRVGYYLGETVTNLRRNLLMTIAAISTVAISLLLLGGVQILGMIVNKATLGWEAKVEISAFLRDDIAQGELQSLQADLSHMPEVEDITYISKAQAFEEFKELYADQPELWETIPPNSLPASVRVKLVDAKWTEEVAARIDGAPGIDEVKFGGEFIKKLLRINALLRTITLVMSLILLVAAAGLIANTIRVAIYARRDEIGIMKLVGATNWFIRIPFMLEGVFAALVGAAVSGAVVLAANTFLFPPIRDFLPFLEGVFAFSGGEIASVLLVLLGVGAGVGIVGSSLALRRFLEV